MTNYKFCCTPEAASDLPSAFDNPTRKLHHVDVITYDDNGVSKQVLNFNYELVGFEYGKDYTHYPTIQIPVEGAIEMIKYALETAANAYRLTHEQNLS